MLSKCFGIEPRVFIVFSVSRYTKHQPCNGNVEEVTALRNKEEEIAAAKAGYRVDFLGFGEPFARPGFTNLSDIFDLSRREDEDHVWPEVFKCMRDHMTGHRGLIIAPLACGSHIDHRIVRRIALDCFRNAPEIQLGFYEDLPYAAAMEDSEILGRVPTEELALHPIVLGTSLADKLSLLRVYESQLSSAQFGKVERYWQRRGGERIWLSKDFHGLHQFNSTCLE